MLYGQHYSSTQTRQKFYKESTEKISHEHRHKNPQQNINYLNIATYKKNNQS